MIDWQPIETAPRDGTGILVCDAKLLDSVISVYWDDEMAEKSNGYGWTVEDFDNKIGYHTGAFTHWMPHPAQPQAS